MQLPPISCSGGSELEGFSPWGWEVVGSNPGQIPVVIDGQSPFLLVRQSILIIRGWT